MKKTIIAATLMVMSFSALAAEPARREVAPAPIIDNKVACYFENVAYSKGAVITVGQVQMQCVRTMGSNGFRGDENPLEWNKLN